MAYGSGNYGTGGGNGGGGAGGGGSNKGNGRRRQVRTLKKKVRRLSNRVETMNKGYQVPTAPSIKNVRRTAKRDWEAANAPLLTELEEQEAVGKDDYEDQRRAYADIYARLQNELGAIPPGDYSGIQQGFNQAIQPYGGASPFDTEGRAPAGEAAAANSLHNTMGVGTQSQISSLAAQDAAYRSSVGRQAPIDLANRQSNALEAYRDLIESLKRQRTAVYKNRPNEIRTATNDLRQQQFEQSLALGEYGLRQSESKAQSQGIKKLIDYFQGLDGGGGGGGNNRGNNRPHVPTADEDPNAHKGNPPSGNQRPDGQPPLQDPQKPFGQWNRGKLEKHVEMVTDQIQDAIHRELGPNYGPGDYAISKSGGKWFLKVRATGSVYDLTKLMSGAPDGLVQDIIYKLRQRKRMNRALDRRPPSGSETRPYGE